MTRRCAWSRRLKNEEAVGRVGPQRHRKKKLITCTSCFKRLNIIAPFRRRTKCEHKLYWLLNLILLIVQKSSTFPWKVNKIDVYFKVHAMTCYWRAIDTDHKLTTVRSIHTKLDGCDVRLVRIWYNHMNLRNWRQRYWAMNILTGVQHAIRLIANFSWNTEPSVERKLQNRMPYCEFIINVITKAVSFDMRLKNGKIISNVRKSQ